MVEAVNEMDKGCPQKGAAAPQLHCQVVPTHGMCKVSQPNQESSVSPNELVAATPHMKQTRLAVGVKQIHCLQDLPNMSTAEPGLHLERWLLQLIVVLLWAQGGMQASVRSTG